MQTLSNKNMIRKNKVFQSIKWQNMTTKERSARWKWARSSKQAKKVREIGKSHYKAVEMVKSLSTVEREKNKKKKMAKAMKYLEEVR